MGEFRMPSLGADMEAGTITEWLVKPGDEVHRGDIVAVVDTDKADVDVEIFEDGVVDELLVPPGTKVPVGTPLARLRAPGAAPVARPEPAPAPVPAPPPVPVPPAPAPAAPVPEPAPAAPVPSEPEAEPVAAVHSPIVRRHAAELGVDLSTVAGTGPSGTVTRADVERAASARQRTSPRARRLATELGVDGGGLTGTGPGGVVTGADVERAAGGAAALVPTVAARVERAPAPTRTADRSESMRRAIATRMARANLEIPHYYLENRVDFTRARAWLDATNAARPVAERLLPAVLLLKATALAAREVPELNGYWIDDAVQASAAVHVGMVISLRGGGLVAPSIHDTDRLTVDELMRALRDLVGRARAGRLRSSEMSDPTITVTNIGDPGVDKVFGVIFPPQLALVGFGAVREQPWAADGMVGARPVVVSTLAGDHRATDGTTGARFLRAVDRLLQKPEEL
jgi:pyruvate dehydrogenase E2 component (dihydrolipoyllysine-residue acetyltransferase)